MQQILWCHRLSIVFCLNSLAPGKFEWNFRHVIFKPILVVDGWGISCEIALIWMSPDFTDDQSTLVQVMAWCRQATSHYMNQCWPRSISPYGVTRPQWVNYHNLADRNILVPKHSVHKQLITRSLQCLQMSWYRMSSIRWHCAEELDIIFAKVLYTLMISNTFSLLKRHNSKRPTVLRDCIYSSYIFNNAPGKYPIMHHFVTEICATKWCIVGYETDALWDLCNKYN